MAATLLFVVLSALFSFYTANLGSYGETYGPLATIIVLLVWFQLSALAVVVGAEVDAELADRAWRERTGLEDPAARAGDAATAAEGLFDALAAHSVEGVLARWHRRGAEHDPLFGELAVPDQLEAHLRELFAAVPDAGFTVDEVSGGDEQAVVRYRLSGTFTGAPWGRMPANGNAFATDAVAVLQVEDGFIVRNDVVYDSAAVAAQLEFRPGSDAAGDRVRAGLATLRGRWRSRRSRRAET
jgi:predicted ester cyclase